MLPELNFLWKILWCGREYEIILGRIDKKEAVKQGAERAVKSCRIDLKFKKKSL